MTLTGVRDEPGVAGAIFGALAEANVNVDMIIQNEPVSHDRRADLSFTVECDDLETRGRGDRAASRAPRDGSRPTSGSARSRSSAPGMRSHPGVAAKVFQTLGENGINIEMISTSPIKISCVIDADQVPAAVKALHQAFELGEDAVRREEPTGTEHRPTRRARA